MRNSFQSEKLDGGWTSYNLPKLISSASGNSSEFFYGPDRQRFKQTASYNGTSETTMYIGGLVENG